MASRPYHLVLRDLPAEAACRELPRIRRALRLPVQFLLCRGRPAACAAGARTDYPPECRGGGRLSRSCRCRDRTASGQRGPGDAGKNRSDRRDRAASRAAASGTDAHRHPARLRAEPDPSRLTTRHGSRRPSKAARTTRESPRASVRSVSMATASASTTSSRRIRCCCRRPSSPAISSPMASG